MQAVGFFEFGGPEVLQVIELQIPTAGWGDVVVEVSAASVNPTDLLMRSGSQATLMAGLKPPFVPGMEFAGRVHLVGEGVERLSVGSWVMGLVDARSIYGGAQAQFIRVPAVSVVELNDGGNLAEAATLPMNGLTADLAIDLLELDAGETILVTGGAGVLGGFTIQLAKLAGLTVVADAYPSDTELVSGLGADMVVPRGEAMFATMRARFPSGVAGAIDAARIGGRISDLVRDGGTYAVVRSTDVIREDRVRGRYVSILQQLSNTLALTRLEMLYYRGILRPRVAIRLPFHKASEAHRMMEEGGLRGRVVLLFNGEDCE